MIRMGMKLYDLLTPGKLNRALPDHQPGRDRSPRALLEPGTCRARATISTISSSFRAALLENVLSARRWGAAV